MLKKHLFLTKIWAIIKTIDLKVLLLHTPLQFSKTWIILTIRMDKMKIIIQMQLQSSLIKLLNLLKANLNSFILKYMSRICIFVNRISNWFNNIRKLFRNSNKINQPNNNHNNKNNHRFHLITKTSINRPILTCLNHLEFNH